MCITFYIHKYIYYKHSSRGMCVGKCARCIGLSLMLLAMLSVTANLFLLFPNLDGSYLRRRQISSYARFLSGVWAGGFMVSTRIMCSFLFSFVGCVCVKSGVVKRWTCYYVISFLPTLPECPRDSRRKGNLPELASWQVSRTSSCFEWQWRQGNTY